MKIRKERMNKKKSVGINGLYRGCSLSCIYAIPPAAACLIYVERTTPWKARPQQAVLYLWIANRRLVEQWGRFEPINAKDDWLTRGAGSSRLLLISPTAPMHESVDCGTLFNRKYSRLPIGYRGQPASRRPLIPP